MLEMLIFTNLLGNEVKKKKKFSLREISINKHNVLEPGLNSIILYRNLDLKINCFVEKTFPSFVEL
jgi:hypothetical protein